MILLTDDDALGTYGDFVEVVCSGRLSTDDYIDLGQSDEFADESGSHAIATHERRQRVERRAPPTDVMML